MDAFDSFLLGCHTRSYKKGEVILMQNTSPDHAYAIKRGIVKTYSVTQEGEEKSIAFSMKGDIFPLSWLFDKTQRTIFFKEAYTDTELYLFGKKQFIELLHTSPELSYSLLSKQVDTLVGLALQVNALEQSRAHKKLLATFQHLSLRHGRAVDANHVRIEIPFTQLELANFVGLTRETMVAELQKLKDAKVITSKAKIYTLDTRLLAHYLEDGV